MYENVLPGFLHSWNQLKGELVTRHFEKEDVEEYHKCLQSGKWSMIPKDVIPHFGVEIPVEKTVNNSIVSTLDADEIPPGADPNVYPYKKYPSQMTKLELIAAAKEFGVELTGKETRGQLRKMLQRAKKDDSQRISEIDSQ